MDIATCLQRQRFVVDRGQRDLTEDRYRYRQYPHAHHRLDWFSFSGVSHLCLHLRANESTHRPMVGLRLLLVVLLLLLEQYRSSWWRKKDKYVVLAASSDATNEGRERKKEEIILIPSGRAQNHGKIFDIDDLIII